MFQLKSILFILCISLCSTQIYAQQRNKDFSKIMHSKSIYEIDAYLRIAHPDDPKRSILKPRLVEMLKEYIKTAHPADSKVSEFQQKLALLRTKPSTRIGYEEMSEIIRQKQIAKYKEELDNNNFGSAQGGSAQQSSDVGSYAGSGSLSTLDAEEQEEFAMLMSVSPIEHKNKTVKILNSLFDNDPKSAESIVLVENKSDCNMIVRIEGIGNFKYRIAVPSRGENSIVVQKGDYLFSSKICGAQYASQNTVQKALMVSLDNIGK